MPFPSVDLFDLRKELKRTLKTGIASKDEARHLRYLGARPPTTLGIETDDIEIQTHSRSFLDWYAQMTYDEQQHMAHVLRNRVLRNERLGGNTAVYFEDMPRQYYRVRSGEHRDKVVILIISPCEIPHDPRAS